MPKTKISVCVLALNEEKNLKICLESIKGLASEIVVGIDDLTTDESYAVASKYTDKVIKLKHENLFHINKQKTVEAATGDWILWLDADETVDKDLSSEIKKVIKNKKVSGYFIPRKNYIFNKWIEHSQFWYPDYQLRLWQKGKAVWPCMSIHEDPMIQGETKRLQNHIIHQNYTSVNQYLEKLIKYTSLDAERRKQEIKAPFLIPMLTRPIEDFIKHFIVLKGYKDGIHGLALSLLQAFYELVVVVRIWELNKFKVEKNITIKQIEKIGKETLTNWSWWKRELEIKETGNKMVKVWNKSLRKLGF